MPAPFWEVMLWITAALSVPPFVLMYAAWIALRIGKLKLARWRRLQRFWFYLGLTLLGLAGVFHLVGPPAAAPAASVALVGGALNAIVATFQARVVDLLTRPPRKK